ncbi:MAG: DUF2399 domain-containing protein [Acidimicrobiia bacterium]|nr:DUF2399 domain-containing protein [Acidimicrobiia bacterium]
MVEVVERDGELVEVRDRRQRRKTNEVVLVHDPNHPAGPVVEADRLFALGAGRRRWSTVVGRYGDEAFEVALSLVRGRVVHLACGVDSRGILGGPRWWQPTEEAAVAVSTARARTIESEQQRDAERESLATALAANFPEVASALRSARSPVAIAVITAAAGDLLAGIDHAGPRAFAQAHFDGTKAHDVAAVLTAANVPAAVLEQLGLRRGDRIGLGGPIVVTTTDGSVDLAPIRGPVALRLDQPHLGISTTECTVVVIENLQPAEVVCARHPALPVVYTAGQFGDDAACLLELLASTGTRVVAIVDADLGGVRIARRVLQAAPAAEVIDVGAWPHPPRPPFDPDGPAMVGLRALADDPLIGWFAASVLDRGYPVEQELATLDIVRHRVIRGPDHRDSSS